MLLKKLKVFNMKDVITDNYKLLHGDCLERMKEIPDGSVDLILTDPPYGTTACKWDSVIPFDLMCHSLGRPLPHQLTDTIQANLLPINLSLADFSLKGI